MDDDVWSNMDLIESVCSRMQIDSAMVADIGLRVLQNCARIRDPTQRTNFRSYCRKRLMLRFARWRAQQERLPDHEQVSRYTEVGQADDSDLNEGGEDWAEMLRTVRSRLSDEEYQLIWSHYVDGASLTMLSQQHGVVRGTIWNRIRKIREKIDASV